MFLCSCMFWSYVQRFNLISLAPYLLMDNFVLVTKVYIYWVHLNTYSLHLMGFNVSYALYAHDCFCMCNHNRWELIMSEFLLSRKLHIINNVCTVLTDWLTQLHGRLGWLVSVTYLHLPYVDNYFHQSSVSLSDSKVNRDRNAGKTTW